MRRANVLVKGCAAGNKPLQFTQPAARARSRCLQEGSTRDADCRSEPRAARSWGGNNMKIQNGCFALAGVVVLVIGTAGAGWGQKGGGGLKIQAQDKPPSTAVHSRGARPV